MNRAFVFPLLLALTATGCGPEEKQPGASVQVFNGTVPSPEESRALVELKLGGKAFCSGVLVHRNWVLTAAHCIQTNVSGWENNPGQVGVFSHFHDNTFAAKKISVMKYQVRNNLHLSADGDMNKPAFDLALIKIEPEDVSEEQLQQALAPIIPESAGLPYRARLTAMGAGLTEPHGFSQGIRKGGVMFVGMFGVHDAEVHVGLSNAGICEGDSGGALLDGQGRLVGIHSRLFSYFVGSENCDQSDGSIAVFLGNRSVRAWIKQNSENKVLAD